MSQRESEETANVVRGHDDLPQRLRAIRWSLFAVFCLASVSLAAAGYWYWRYEVRAIRKERFADLKAIAELKVGQIVQWHMERLGDARVISQGSFLGQAIRQWLETQNQALKADIAARLQLVQESYGYSNAVMAAPDGRVLISLDSRLTDLDASAKDVVARAVSSREAVFGDFFRCPDCKEVHSDVAAPVHDADGRPAAVVILRTDPDQYLYPLIQSWPTPSRTAETLLVRREGDSVLFLNKLRHRPDAALSLRVPLSRTDVPAVQAVLGRSGEFEGTDYRGVAVLADIRPVPDSPWFMVAKVDTSEILAEAGYRGLVSLGFVSLSILLVGLVSGLLFYHRRRDLYRSLYHAERRQREAQEIIRTTLYSIGDAVIATDAASRITRMNPVAEALTGWREAEALGKPLEDVFRIVNEETRAEVENPVARVIREGIVVGLANHTLLVARDGTERPIADSGAPIRNDDGEIIGVVLVFRDQTEQRRAQRELWESRELYRTTLYSIGDAVIAVDIHRRVRQINPVAEALTGWKETEALGKPLEEVFRIVNEETRAEVENPVARVIREGIVVGLANHTLLVARDGSDRSIADSGAPIRNDDGEIIGVVLVFRDQTEQRRAQQALLESEKRYRLLADNTLDVIWQMDLDRRMTYANPAVQTKFGYTVEEFVGSRLDAYCTPERLQEIQAVLARELADLEHHTSVVLETEMLHKDGRSIPVEVHAKLLLDKDGRPAGVQGTARDITDRKRAEDDLRKANARLEQALAQAEQLAVQAEAANRAKSDFLANMSHEIRTPMTAILGFSDLLAASNLPPQEQRELLAGIQRNGKALLDLLSDILDLSRIEADRLTMEKVDYPLRQVIGDVLAVTQVRAERKGLALEVKYEFPVPETIRTDPVRLRQVLVNLTGNAVKFTERGGVCITVRCLQERNRAARIQFAVSDTGIGIPGDRIDDLFQPFMQVDTSTTRRHGGSGLGLVISKRLAQALGGDLEVASEPGKGSTFTLTIDAGPLEGVRMLDAPPAAEPVCEQPPATEEAPALCGRVLFAEDAHEVASVIGHVLKEMRLDVEIAEDGRIACAMAERSRAEGRPYDLILMDIQMPNMNGYEATRWLREHGWKGPIVALTAHALVGDREKCLAAGCDDYIAKPITVASLRSVLACYLPHAAAPPPPASTRQEAGDGSASLLGGGLLPPETAARLAEAFAAELPSRAKAIDSACRQQEYRRLAELAHQLKGTAAVYGFSPISDAARTVHQLAAEEADWQRLEAAVAELLRECNEQLEDLAGYVARPSGEVVE